MSGLHHPSDEVLIAYAGGHLRPAFALVAGAHIRGCARCRAEVRLLEDVGGVLLEDLPAAAMAPDAFAHLMARIERPSQPIELSDADREDLLSALKLKRKRWLAPGVWMAPVDLEAAGDDLVYVLRVPAGARTFPHGHNGREFTAVLKGAYDDGAGVYSAGDFQEIDADHEHQPVISRASDCICLIVSEAPMRMQSRLGRLAQLFLNV
jgi:putative transcriptional regulator